jgi:hypothetical protein
MAQPLSQNARLGSFKLDLDEVIYSTDDEASPELLVPQEVQAAAAAAGYAEDIPGESAQQGARNGFAAVFSIHKALCWISRPAAGSALRMWVACRVVGQPAAVFALDHLQSFSSGHSHCCLAHNTTVAGVF